MVFSLVILYLVSNHYLTTIIFIDIFFMFSFYVVVLTNQNQPVMWYYLKLLFYLNNRLNFKKI